MQEVTFFFFFFCLLCFKNYLPVPFYIYLFHCMLQVGEFLAFDITKLQSEKLTMEHYFMQGTRCIPCFGLAVKWLLGCNYAILCSHRFRFDSPLAFEWVLLEFWSQLLIGYACRYLPQNLPHPDPTYLNTVVSLSWVNEMYSAMYFSLCMEVFQYIRVQ